MSDPETTVLDVYILYETDKAYQLIDRNGDETDTAWFPKSELVWERLNHIKKEGRVEIPNWLLDKNNW